VARLHARPLDTARPLWELYVIEGLDNVTGVPEGSFAFALKVHHAAIDGASGVEMLAAIHSQTAKVVDPTPPETPWQPERDPLEFELLTRASFNILAGTYRLAQSFGRLVSGLDRAAGELRSGTPTATAGLAPRTRFNGPVTAHRVLDARFFPFAELRPMRAPVEGATVNDVALTVVGGALRLYLDSVGELPARPLRAMTPISLRTEAQRADPATRSQR